MKLGHKMIRASAGSGKTHTLVSRYIHLLALEIPPSRICALTFTRKAAGEFFQKILLRLKSAASNAGEAGRLAAEIGIEEATTDRFRELLARFIEGMGDLQMGTIDQFFGRIVGAFPYEIGLSRPHRILDSFAENQSRARALEELLAYGSQERGEVLLHRFKELTWGAEEKRVFALFEDRLSRHHALFCESGAIRLWGAGERIFEEPPWWLAASGRELDDVLKDIREEVQNLQLNRSRAAAIEGLLARFEGWVPGMPFTGNAFYERLLLNRENLLAGEASITVNRGQWELPPRLCSLLGELIRLQFNREIGRRLVTTRSLGQLIADYDQLYGELIREAGLLVFSDLPILLMDFLGEGNEAGLSDQLLYRLDGQTDHWLIDEFQDTSRIQWKVLSAFIDEVLQDPEGRRTFFAVGDVKQSIYRWRGGDSRLFNEIQMRYAVNGHSVIEDAPLHLSWRSAPPVLDCVNAVFGSGIAAAGGDSAAATRWRNEWQAHMPSPKTREAVGYAAWGIVREDAGIHQSCIEIIRRHDPLASGCSCAVLVRSNDEVSSMTQALREAGIPASMEGVVHICLDSVVGTWIRAFLYALARPGERFPVEYLGLTGPRITEPEFRKLAGRFRDAVSRDGYAAGIRVLLDRVLDTGDDAFLERRADQILEAATRFESSSDPTLENFIQYLESAAVAESSLCSQVQVMTVHKAKGLDFDMVLVAGFGAEALVRPRREVLHAERNETGEIQWILDFPNKLFVDHEPVLSSAARREKDLDLFEAFCLLYVAMTRARHALICLAGEPVRKCSDLTWMEIFSAGLGGYDPRPDGCLEWQWERGEVDWISHVSRVPVHVSGRAHLSRLSVEPDDWRPFPQRGASPSEEAHGEDGLPEVLPSSTGRRFGTLMHDFLAEIDWIDYEEENATGKLIDRADPRLRERLRTFLNSPPGKEIFTRPRESCRVWREKPYVMKEEGRLVRGIIDRAVLYLDEEKEVRKVVIQDYKTDYLDPDRPADEQLRERYGSQVERYREAVSVLARLPVETIEVRLVPV